MARPVKTGLDYFPLRIDFFDDIRISAVTVEHGTKGQLAAIMLLVHLYKTGYYLVWDRAARVRVLKDMPGVTPDELDRIVECLVEWDFFDKTLFEQEHVLTGKDMQRHFFHATKRRKNNTAQMPFLLAETNETVEGQQKQPVEAPEKGDEGKMREETGLMSTTTPLMQTDSTQEYNKKNKIIKNYLFSPSSSTTAHTYAKSDDNSEEMVDNNTVSTVTIPVVGNVNAEVEQLKANSQWVEMMCMHRHLTPMLLHQKLDEFARECLCRGKNGHNNLADTQSHFCNWLTINSKQNNTNPYHETTRRNKTADEHVADAQRWAYEETLKFLQSPERRSDDIPTGFPF